ncbi:MAG: hypothetical protein OXI88_13235 [Gammaproteobacteria bacterium]|nr:hypothetical protein [Gammaproteobacteria bacterium]
MSDILKRRHALVSFLDRGSAPGPDNSNARLEVRSHYGYLNLRGAPGDERFMQAVRETLGQPLPTLANTFTAATHTQRGRNPADNMRGHALNPSPASTPSCTIYWLGPDEWLLVTALGRESDIAEQLGENLAGQCYSLVDVTGGQIMIRLRGPRAREVLARGCTLDLHPRSFKAGQCAQSTLAKTSMLIALVEDAPTFDIIIRRSFAEYAARWLRHSGASVHFRHSR